MGTTPSAVLVYLTKASKSPLPFPLGSTKKGKREEFRSSDQHRRETNVIPRMTKKTGPGNLETQASISELGNGGRQKKVLEIKRDW